MTDIITASELYDEERKLEAEAVDAGYARYMRLAAEAPERTPPGHQFIRRMVPPTAASIAAWVESEKKGRQAGLAHFTNQLSPEAVAFIVARAVLTTMGAKLTRVAGLVTENLEAATMGEALHAVDPKAWARLQDVIARTAFPGKRHVLVKDAMGKFNIKRIHWGPEEKARLGAMLVVMCADATGMFKVEAVRKRKKRTPLMVRPTPETAQWLEQAHEQADLHTPLYTPMVVPPRPWSQFSGGGYLTGALKLDIVNGRAPRPAYVEEMKNTSMPMVYTAINALQTTPWRINIRVLDVMRLMWDQGSQSAKLPSRDPLSLPAAPWGDGPPPTPEALREYKLARGRIHEINDSLVSKRLALSSKLSLAEKFKGYEAIYFPHAIDWRGRMYPVTAHVNPQADDTGRALLEFANGCALGEDGAYWLAVHGANCFGIDKVSFEDRVKWVEAHRDPILESARGTSQFWADAEDPFMFLAFCFEWADLMEHARTQPDVGSFVSTLPVSWDGSCNGLQNFSAMLRDPIGGAATNLVPSDVPADIYQRVADVAAAQVRKDAEDGEVNARYWLGKVTRKIAKRPTMTLPYGSGRFGFRDQLLDELDHLRLDNGGVPYISGNPDLTCRYMANNLYESLGHVVVAALRAMDWLREVSKVVSEEDLPVWWTAPSGFRPMQDYRILYVKRVVLRVNGRNVKLTLQMEGQKRDKRKQAQGISPNFVHALDAAHLARTVEKCVNAGVSSFAMVHDSYGTHAGNATALHQMLREAFVEQYTGNTLMEFRDELVAQLSPTRAAQLPPPPPMGALDLTEVLRSEYFFA